MGESAKLESADFKQKWEARLLTWVEHRDNVNFISGVDELGGSPFYGFLAHGAVVHSENNLAPTSHA